MRRGWIWGGFGALLVVGIVTGYAPDVMLASAQREARAKGLLTAPPAKIPYTEDARVLFNSGTEKYADAPSLLANDFARQTKTPAPHVTKYLDAIAVAAKRPRCSPLEEEWSGRYSNRADSAALANAGRALAIRATDETTLLAAARIAYHLGTQSSWSAAIRWGTLVPAVLDRAGTLDLSADARRRLALAMGPATPPREKLWRHVVATVQGLEEMTRSAGASVGRTRQENGYLRFWLGFFAKAPSDTGFADAVHGADSQIQTAESQGGQYVDYPTLSGAPKGPWTQWVDAVERANARIAQGR